MNVLLYEVQLFQGKNHFSLKLFSYYMNKTNNNLLVIKNTPTAKNDTRRYTNFYKLNNNNETHKDCIFVM